MKAKTIFFMALFGLAFVSNTSALLYDDIKMYYNFDSKKEIVFGIYNLTNNQGSVAHNNSNCLIGNCSQLFTNTNLLIPTNPHMRFNDSSSINFWFRPTNISVPVSDEFVIMSPQNTTGRISLWNNSTWNFNGWTNNTNSLVNKTLPTVNAYHMITITRNNSVSRGNVTIYINGVLQESGTRSIINNTDPIQWLIGTNFNNASDYAGTQIDEMGIWAKTLTAAEINQLYNAGAGIPYSEGGLTVTLNYPSQQQILSSQSITFNATLTPNTGFNLTNATIFLYNSTGAILNMTNNVVLGNNSNDTFWTISLPNAGTYMWNVLGCANNVSGGVGYSCRFSTSNTTFFRQNFAVNTETYDGMVYDTDNSTFSINISVDPSVTFFSASLNYNNTNYLGTFTQISSSEYIISRTIDAPVVSSTTSKNFNWTITFETDSGFSFESTTLRSQNISPTNITLVSPLAINFTLLDEETLQPVKGRLDVGFDWYLGGGTVTKKTSYARNTDNSFAFGILPGNQTFFTSSKLTVHNGSLASNLGYKYETRIFDFNKDALTNNTTNRTLLLIGTNNATNVVVQVKDSSLRPYEGVYVIIERFYDDSIGYKMVENRRTDVFGQFSAKLVENEVRYRAKFYDSNNTLLKSTGDFTISCLSSVCILPFVIEDTTNQFNRFSNVTGFDYTFTFNNNTNIFTFTWNDNSGNTATKRILVQRYLFNSSTIVCNQTSTSAIGSLTCNVGSQRASYLGQVYYKQDGAKEQRLTITQSVKVGDPSSTFGLEGLMWSAVLLLTMILLGMWSPPVGIALYLAAFIFLGVTGIVYINPAIIVAELVLGVLFIWAFRS